MGNCLRNNHKISSSSEQDHDNYQIQTSSSEESKVEKIEAPHPKAMMKKKVRFKIENDEECDNRGIQGDSRNGVVRIRLVMTQEELKQMMNYNDETSLEKLLDVVKLRGAKNFELGEFDEGRINSWKPALESIPEDRLIN